MGATFVQHFKIWSWLAASAEMPNDMFVILSFHQEHFVGWRGRSGAGHSAYLTSMPC